MKAKIDCKYAKCYDEKHIKCKRDNSLRNINKKTCKFYCCLYKKKFWVKIKELFLGVRE